MPPLNKMNQQWHSAYAHVSNHFHLALWPAKVGNLSRWMQWLLTTHVRRYQRHYHSSGHIWQGRFTECQVSDSSLPRCQTLFLVSKTARKNQEQSLTPSLQV